MIRLWGSFYFLNYLRLVVRAVLKPLAMEQVVSMLAEIYEYQQEQKK